MESTFNQKYLKITCLQVNKRVICGKIIFQTHYVNLFFLIKSHDNIDFIFNVVLNILFSLFLITDIQRKQNTNKMWIKGFHVVVTTASKVVNSRRRWTIQSQVPTICNERYRFEVLHSRRHLDLLKEAYP